MNRRLGGFVGLLLAWVTVGCASAIITEEIKKEPKTREKDPLSVSAPVSEPTEPAGDSIDYLGLSRALGLERSATQLGYTEKSFDTCAVGYGFSSSNHCRREVFITMQFQIMCRDSDGTISTALAREDMRPLSGRSVKWTLKSARGVTQLDGEGFGQIRTIALNSQRLERLKIAIDNDFVYIRAGELKRLVTPRNWCN